MEGENTKEQTPMERMLHSFRKAIDKHIKITEEQIEAKPKFIREMSLVRTKLQEAKMWTGKCLEVEGAPFPEELRDEAETPEPKTTTPPIEDEVNNN